MLIVKLNVAYLHVSLVFFVNKDIIIHPTLKIK